MDDRVHHKSFTEQELRLLTARLRRADAIHQSPAQRIQAYVSTMIDYLDPAEQRQRTSLFASLQIEPVIDELIQPLRVAIRDGRRAGIISSQQPDEDAQAIFDLIIGLMATQATVATPVSPQRVETTVRQCITHALRIAEL